MIISSVVGHRLILPEAWEDPFPRNQELEGIRTEKGGECKSFPFPLPLLPFFLPSLAEFRFSMHLWGILETPDPAMTAGVHHSEAKDPKSQPPRVRCLSVRGSEPFPSLRTEESSVIILLGCSVAAVPPAVAPRGKILSGSDWKAQAGQSAPWLGHEMLSSPPFSHFIHSSIHPSVHGTIGISWIPRMVLSIGRVEILD